MPPADKAGWPWTGARPDMWEKIAPASALPRITVVTPSFNQGAFLEETIRSVLLQGYPNLEYIIIDGGSTDGSVEIIRKYEEWLTYWISEPDRGQTHALNKGFERATGNILAYLNSDDLYMPYTFDLIARIFRDWPEVSWITGHRSYTVGDGIISPNPKTAHVFNQHLFRTGFHLYWLFGWNQQPSTFWRRDLFAKAGARFDEAHQCTMDLDLWIKMAHHAPLVYVGAVLATMRQHAAQKSRNLRLDVAEIESKASEYGFAPLAVRRALHAAVRVPGLRGLLRRLWCRGDGRVIRWSAEQEQWEMVKKYVF